MCVSSCWRELEENLKSNKTLDNWAELPRVSRCPKIRKGEEEEEEKKANRGLEKRDRGWGLMVLI